MMPRGRSHRGEACTGTPPGTFLFTSCGSEPAKKKNEEFERRMSKISSVKGTPFGRSAFRSLLFSTVLRRVCK